MQNELQRQNTFNTQPKAATIDDDCASFKYHNGNPKPSSKIKSLKSYPLLGTVKYQKIAKIRPKTHPVESI